MKEFTITDSLEDLDAESKYLVHKAREATAHAYAPYSRFLVGAALLLEGDIVVAGSNQENAAYPSGMCAERVALYSAATLHPDVKILKLAVVAKRKTGKDLIPATCCGACRQVMLEFELRQQDPIVVIMQGNHHQWIKSSSAASLLPFAFDKDSLEKH
jgi:cytidine deaminase